MPPTLDIEMGPVQPSEGVPNADPAVAGEGFSTARLEAVPELTETTPAMGLSHEKTVQDGDTRATRRNHKPWQQDLPKIEGDCWDNVTVAVNKYDDDKVKDWNNDIDTVLIFAGLFSAVVTAFVIESYQWLSEDPSNKAVRILSQLSEHLGTANIAPEDQAPFKVDFRSIRINSFWFLSLLLALSAASTGILAKQWLREYRRDAALSSKQSLALRQLRYQSWHAWKVPGIIATLPLLLECALILFFAGVLDLLFPLNAIVFALASTVAGLTVLFLVLTTSAPTLYVWLRFFRHTHRDIPWHNLNPCAFKSPQSLIVLRLLYPLSSTILQLPYLRRSSWVVFEGWFLDLPSIFDKPTRSPTYLQRGLRWMVANFTDNIVIIKNILHCVDLLVKNDDDDQALQIPVASYVTHRDQYPPDHALLRYLAYFRNDPEVDRFCVELFIRCMEQDLGVQHRIPIPESPLSDVQVDRLLAATDFKVKSQHFSRSTFWQSFTALGVLWHHPRPEIHKLITEILHVIVRRIEQGPPAGSDMCFVGHAWEWFNTEDMTAEFMSSEVFRDFFLWAERLAIEANTTAWVEDGGLRYSWDVIKVQIMDRPNGHKNMFSSEVNDADVSEGRPYSSISV
ncbi:hypothetical protein C8J56DRAFT_383109 [Mycena floridula]|nr:hypothetical protein C8J56DRAFT_383109 [Mycena floridula]